MIIEWIKLRLMVLADIALAAMTFVEEFDITIRIISAICATGLAVYGMIHYHSKIKLNRIDRRIKEETLNDIIESNKKKYGGSPK